MIHRCSSFSLELLQAIHDFDNDTIKAALFDGNASFSSATTAYSTSNEISASGYTAGGVTVAPTSAYPKLEDGNGAVRFDQASWALTSGATIKWALLYNSSKSDRAIVAIDLGDARTVSGTFNLNFPLTVAPLVKISHPVT